MTGPRTAVAEPRARFRDLLAAEWMKLWSLRSTPWALAVGALIIIGINVNATIADYTNWPRYPEGIRTSYVPSWSIRNAFTDGSGLALMLITGSIGALTIVGEYGTGQLRTTFAAVPARRSVVAAKTAVVTAVMVAYGTAVAAFSFWVSQAILSGRDIGLSIGYPGALRAVVGSALLAPVCALVGMGIGAIVRHTAATVVTLTFVLLLLPSLFNERNHWTATVLHALPQGAWERLTQLGVPPVHVPYPWTLTGAWTVYGLWALVAVVVTVVAVHRRDP
ncbi:ABC transporter permease [Streptomyces paludis]|uniref:ABC transporter permease n=1 Tax=Streptomyces paludis TaxID=2282738 RepID=A0A345HXP5_9ACTN|nr:ABC transporter permease [Streptomyces paludis]AXG81469.1 ABC transporter permease [Streptomyces paludis]